MFVGGGRNGKGKTIELLKRLIGAQNCSSLPLSLLFPESFAVSDLFGKMLNLAGDIGNTDFKDTSTFKGLTGRDIITGQRKFLNGLVFQNYAKFVFACNELPNVSDMSRGFWDRWILLEFPYTFVTQEEYDTAKDKAMLKIKDDYILDKIVTEVELSGLLNAGLDGLDRLTKNKKFSTTSGTKEVKDLWIRKSNSFIAFAYDFLEEDYEHHIPKKDMRKRYSVYSKKHGVMSKSDFVIKKVLQEMFGVSDEKIGYPDQIYVWQGVRWKNSI
jgi:putative DNA primase/helicase